MRIRDPSAEAEEPFNLIPLTDMVFNLLIFFMAATTFARVERELGVQLPQATIASGTTADVPQLVINITETGEAVVNRKTYPPAELRALVESIVAKNRNVKVAIRADERGTVAAFARVLELCKAAGVAEANIGYFGGA